MPSEQDRRPEENPAAGSPADHFVWGAAPPTPGQDSDVPYKAAPFAPPQPPGAAAPEGPLVAPGVFAAPAPPPAAPERPGQTAELPPWPAAPAPEAPAASAYAPPRDEGFAPQGSAFAAQDKGFAAPEAPAFGPAPRGYGAPPPHPPALPALAAPPKRRRRHGRPGRAVLGVAAVIAMLGVFLASLSVFTLTSAFAGLLSPPAYLTEPPAGTFSVVPVVGAIQNLGNDPYSPYAPSYCHDDTLNHIKLLAESENNAGILLYLNTPGGTVYESDELYLALMNYKEQTGRPVWAYMADMCASGGYYVAAAADHIMANRNTTTGSIGVYVALTDTSGLYEKLGIETVLVKSGENKGTGMEGVPITPAQREVYQSVVDESYEQFVALVAEGRALPDGEVRALADGRIYTGAQAQKLGLVDELGDWDTIFTDFEAHTGAAAFWPSFNQQVGLARLVGSLSAALPTGDAEAALAEAERYPAGVPMAMYNP